MSSQLSLVISWQRIYNSLTVNLTLFILVRHSSELNHRLDTIKCDSTCIYLLPLHVSVS
jgi:Mlc titration factor MtfA (ptsG expression regulator)